MFVNNLQICSDELRTNFDHTRLLFAEPMSRQTTFKIGGPADILFFPASTEEVQKVFHIINKYDCPYTILGNGSNVLVSDKGIRGLVIKFNQFSGQIKLRGTDEIVAGAGAMLKDVSLFAGEHSLSGLEFAIGIPGSIGGAVYMNAGAYDGEIENVVSGVIAVDKAGNIHHYDREQLQFAYRHSIFQENGEVICEVELQLTSADKENILARMADLTQRRESKQPLDMPSAGSTFKRPPGYFAGTLIDQTGLKGFSVGGAQISLKHAGFVINTGNATAKDVLTLISEVQKRVYAKHGVHLYPEVKLVGEQ